MVKQTVGEMEPLGVEGDIRHPEELTPHIVVNMQLILLLLEQ